MLSSDYSKTILILFQALVPTILCLDYSMLETLDATCSPRDKCDGYANNLSYSDRNCECDFACNTYKDCCIDGPRIRTSRQRSPVSEMICLPYGGHQHGGVYVINKCKNNWNGNAKIIQMCEEADDWSDPINAAPVTSMAQGVTYLNRYCAECNNAVMETLQTFHILLSCNGLEALSEQQIIDDLQYNEDMKIWGVNRMNYFGNATLFYGCDVIFNVPSYLNSSVRFCRANIISNCSSTYTRVANIKLCEGYMAVVYDNEIAYRNPHCVLCNHKSIKRISCTMDIMLGKKRPLSVAHMFNPNLGYENGSGGITTPSCSSNQVFDTFKKDCRSVICALPGMVLRNGRCE